MAGIINLWSTCLKFISSIHKIIKFILNFWLSFLIKKVISRISSIPVLISLRCYIYLTFTLIPETARIFSFEFTMSSLCIRSLRWNFLIFIYIWDRTWILLLEVRIFSYYYRTIVSHTFRVRSSHWNFICEEF